MTTGRPTLNRASLVLQKSVKYVNIYERLELNFGDCCFATAGPTLWNSLPEQPWQPDITFRQFKRSLKTFMFG